MSFQSYLTGIEIFEEWVTVNCVDMFQSYLTGIEIPSLTFRMLWELCSNRTLLELKCGSWRWLDLSPKFQSYLTGIEIDVSGSTFVPSFCSNRTLLELKCCWCPRISATNWVPIVPYWNWNKEATRWREMPNSSNRTLLELKFQTAIHALCDSLVPIAPYWNWNLLIFDEGDKLAGSNRTILELKWRTKMVKINSHLFQSYLTGIKIPWESRKKLWALSVSAVTHWCAFDRYVLCPWKVKKQINIETTVTEIPIRIAKLYERTWDTHPAVVE